MAESARLLRDDNNVENEGHRVSCRSQWRHLAHRLLRTSLGRLIGYGVTTPRRCLVLTTLLLIAVTPILAPSYSRPPPQYRALESRCGLHGAKGESQAGCANSRNENVYISASLYDPNGLLVNGEWGKSLLELIHLIGDDHVFLSIYENDGGREEEEALSNLKSKLRCRHALVHDGHYDGAPQHFPTVKLPDGSARVKRIAYLAEMRNRSLRPLDTSSQGDIQYDKILFLNDIAFHAIEAAQLLFSTNVGADGKTRYLAACGLDYYTPFLYYDTFALRDVEGYSAGVPMFPIFADAGRGLSRAAMLAEADAVPVSSCWGGIVAVQAEHVQNLGQTLPDPNYWEAGHHMIEPASPRNVTTPVRFRHEPEVFYEACECCLFLADVTQATRRDGRTPGPDTGVYVNPYVRVAYRRDVLFWQRFFQRWERLYIIPQTIISKVASMPKHNPYRDIKENDNFVEEVWVGNGKDGHWELIPRRARNGMFCGTRKMLTIKPGKTRFH